MLVAIPKLKSPVSLIVLPTAGGRILGFMPFPSAMGNANSLVQYLNSRHRVHFAAMISITPRAPHMGFDWRT